MKKFNLASLIEKALSNRFVNVFSAITFCIGCFGLGAFFPGCLDSVTDIYDYTGIIGAALVCVISAINWYRSK